MDKKDVILNVLGSLCAIAVGASENQLINE